MMNLLRAISRFFAVVHLCFEVPTSVENMPVLPRMMKDLDFLPVVSDRKWNE
jgi:hypothetical protein